MAQVSGAGDVVHVVSVDRFPSVGVFVSFSTAYASIKKMEMQIKPDTLLSECSNALDIIETTAARIFGTGALKCKAKQP